MNICWQISFFQVYFIVFSFADNCNVKIASFNIQNLSPRKLQNEVVRDTLNKIITGYDIVLVQEVQDKSETVCGELLDVLNKDDARFQYRYVISPRTGKTKGEEEQYATFYRSNIVEVVNHELYPDPDDIFTRNPHLVQLKFFCKAFPMLMMVNLHAKPDATSNKETVKEIKGLADVHQFIKQIKKIQNVVYMGDMNAGGRYVTQSDWNDVKIRHDPQYQWLIDDETDTTVGRTCVAYDRIILTGKRIRSLFVNFTVNRFNEKPNGCCVMTQEQALKVSDHYPVEMMIRA